MKQKGVTQIEIIIVLLVTAIAMVIVNPDALGLHQSPSQTSCQ